tara:strand:+ start:2781 stop:3440 length:660 start_codon:yes stop_codon:yes gene_type:complete
MNKELKKRIFSSIVLIPIVFFFVIKGSFLFNFLILICFFIASYEWYNMSRKKTYCFPGIFFLVISFYTVYQIRTNSQEFEYGYFMFIFLICISTDLGGYIFGKFFKGPKLTKISPKKTFSGVIGSYLLSIIMLSIYSKSIFSPYQENELTFRFFIVILLISTISQLGDIIISYFKRLSKIKDTGKIIPGHGGLLDRVDGMVFAFPFSYLIFKINILQYF